MKILFIIDSLAAGGKERQLIGLFREIRKRKDIVPYLIVLYSNIDFKEFENLDINYKIMHKKRFFDYKLFRNLIKEVSNFNPDIIHTWEWYSTLAILPAKIIKNKTLINGSIRYGQTVNMFSKLWFYSFALFPFSKRVIANSISGLKAHSKKKSNKYKVIYNGFDLTRTLGHKSNKNELLSIEIPENSMIVGMVARFNLPKDYLTVVKAVDKLQNKYKNLYFMMVGDGDKRDEIEAAVNLLKYKEKFIFTGKRNDIEDIVNIFDIAVLICNTNGFAEGLSNSIMEYMACKKPVIATESGGNKELIDDNVTGYLVDAFNVEQLSEKIEILMNDKAARDNLGQKGYEKIKNNFSEVKMYEDYLKMYKEVQ